MLPLKSVFPVATVFGLICLFEEITGFCEDDFEVSTGAISSWELLEVVMGTCGGTSDDDTFLLVAHGLACLLLAGEAAEGVVLAVELACAAELTSAPFLITCWPLGGAVSLTPEGAEVFSSNSNVTS